MVPSPSEILKRIQDGALLPAAAVAAIDHDAILDARDADSDFEAAWKRCYDEVEFQWAGVQIEESSAALAEQIRKDAFLAASRASGQHEIASYVSDDFDIIVRGALLGLTDDFLDKLWDAYARGGIPSPVDVG